MKNSDLAYVVSCVFGGVYSLAYCSVTWFHIKLPRYYPLEHTWKMVNEKGVPSQGWYSTTAFAFVVSAIVALVAHFALRPKRSRDIGLNAAAVRWIGIVSILAIIGGMVFMAFHEFVKWGVL
jgi:uncharacterized membrane protein YhaH (DUF805 family)